MVIVSAIAILLAICLIVFLIETNAVPERKTVVRGHQVDGGRRSFAIAFKQIAGSGKASGELPQRQISRQPESAYGIAIMVVPLGKQRREIAHLVAAFTNIPRLGNQLHLREHRTVSYRLKQRRLLAERRRASHHRCQVETKTVDVERFHPIFQACIRKMRHRRMAEVERVTATGPVVVITILSDPIIATVINSAHGERRTVEIAFRAVVQHHVQNHFDTRRMKRLHRIAKLIPRLVRVDGIARVERKHCQRVVAPVVAQPQPLQARLAGEMGDGQQLQSGDPEVFQIGDHGRMAERLIGAAHLFGDRRMEVGQPFYMGLIYNGVAPRRARRGIVFPVVVVTHHHAFRDDMGAVAVVGFPIAGVENRVIFKFALHAVGTRINQQLRRVKPVPLRRLPGTMNAKTVVHSKPPAGQVAVPGIPGACR